MSAETSCLPAEEEPSSSSLTLDVELREGHALGAAYDWQALIIQTVDVALDGSGRYENVPADLYVELVSDDRSQELNRDYRGKDKPTNILSFPGVEPEELQDMIDFAKAGGPPLPLGDLIIADCVVVREAAEQNKPVDHHFAHLLVHGVLHLLGYDHIEEDEAEKMETLERHILSGLDIPDPYRDEADG